MSVCACIRACACISPARARTRVLTGRKGPPRPYQLDDVGDAEPVGGLDVLASFHETLIALEPRSTGVRRIHSSRTALRLCAGAGPWPRPRPAGSRPGTPGPRAMKPDCPGRGQDAQRGLPERLCEAGEAVHLLLNVTRRAECSCHRWPLAKCSKSCQVTGPRPRTEAQLPAALCPAGPSVPSPGNPLSCLLRALLRRGNGSSCLRGPMSRVRPSLGSLPCRSPLCTPHPSS